jgi:hypothetical protein
MRIILSILFYPVILTKIYLIDLNLDSNFCYLIYTKKQQSRESLLP